MIRIIGFQRVLLILMLAFLVVASFAYMTFLLKPSLLTDERDLSTTRSEVSQMSTDMDNLRQGITKFSEQKDSYERITQHGFFDFQDKSATRQRINEMQKESGVLFAKFNIFSGKTEKNEDAVDAGYKISNTPMTFSIGAIDDVDIYKFIYLLNYGFPGLITIESLQIERDIDITLPVLRAIGVGSPEPIVKAELRVSWRAMIPDSSITDGSSEEEEGAY